MRQITLVLAATLVAVTLAGCTDTPPSGEFASTRNGITATGSAALEYQEEVKPIQEAVPGAPIDCVPDEAPGMLNGEKCVDPYTNVSIHFMSLPDSGAGSYEAFFVDDNGTELAIGALEKGEGSMYTLDKMFDVDHEGHFTKIQARLGSYVIAESPVMEGENNFAMSTAAPATVTATWKAKALTLTATGLQEGVQYTGWLVTMNEETGEADHVESFTINAAGETVYDAEMNINKYDELHVHVADSKINVAIATIA